MTSVVQSSRSDDGYGHSFSGRVSNPYLWLDLGRSTLFGSNDPNIIQGVIEPWLLPGGGSVKLTRGVLSSWRNVNFKSMATTIRYHFGKHALGSGKSIAQYTDDALNFFKEFKSTGKEWVLRDGSKGIKIKAPDGRFGIYDDLVRL